MHQALSLCSSIVAQDLRFEAAFFEAVRVLVLRITHQGAGEEIFLPEMNKRINELLKLAKQISEAQKEGEQLGLTADELAFYDALTKPDAIKDFYENEELIAITKELADVLRKNRTIDWQERSSARAKMRMLIKKLLKKHRYPPEGMEDAVQTVMAQCELWTDNQEMAQDTPPHDVRYEFQEDVPIAAEGDVQYGSGSVRHGK